MDIATIAKEINRAARSSNHRISHFQESRKDRLQKDRVPAKVMFGNGTIEDSYAYHTGGLTELQYNIALEKDGTMLRYGIAFSLQRNQSSPDPLLDLGPKMDR